MKKIPLAALLLCLLPLGPSAEEPSGNVAARRVLNRYQEAVVWISAVVKVQMGGMGVQFGSGQEYRVETLGTVISREGLVVASYSMLDPMGTSSDGAYGFGEEEMQFDVKVRFSEVVIRLADDTEVPARLVLKDPDLDLAFLLPHPPQGGTPPRSFVHIPLERGGTADLLDDLILLGRLGQSLDRQPSLAFGRVSAVVRKPRTFYVGSMYASDFGTPVFTLDEKPLGICLIRKAPQPGASMSMSMSGGLLSSVVLPCDQILEIAEQATEDREKSPGRASAETQEMKH